MQVTIDIPEDLAQRLEPEREHLRDIIERGLRQRGSEKSGLSREVVAFLARGPQPREIVGFRPSAKFLQRASALLEKNRERNLTAAEEAELDELANLDHLVSLIKAEARLHLQQAA